MRINLDVPFEEKDMVKNLGAKWDHINRVWYIVNVDDLRPFWPWIKQRDNKLCNQTKENWDKINSVLDNNNTLTKKTKKNNHKRNKQ